MGHHRGVANLSQRWQERAETTRKLHAVGDCPACGHSWVEHGFGNDVDGMCGECAYEFEHGQRETSEPGCKLSAPPNDLEGSPRNSHPT